MIKKLLNEKNRLILTVFISALSLMPLKNRAEDTENLGSIKTIIGKAEVRYSKSGKWRPANVGMKVKVDWEIRTHLESTLELSFRNGSVVKLGENSIVSISTLLTNSIIKKTGNKSNNSINVIPVTE